MTRRLEAALEVCLQAIQTGASLEACLALYPDLAADLRPALQAAARLRHAPADGPDPAGQARSRSRMLRLAASARSQRRRRLLLQPWPRLGAAFAAALLALVTGWGALTAAASPALPGETLYPVKRVDESLRLQLVRDGQSREALMLSYNQRREAEAQELLRQGRKGPVSFEGVVELQESGLWTIASLPVALEAETRISGEIGPGDSVIVSGSTRPEGDILASEIVLHTYQLGGRVEEQTLDRWIVAGQPLRIESNSQIQPGIRPGDPVFVVVEVQPDGAHDALVILTMAPPTLPPGPASPGAAEVSPTTRPSAERTPEETRFEFSGVLEARQGSIWSVGGRVLLQTAESDIRGAPQPGDRVRVRALVSDAGGLLLLRIEPIDEESRSEGSPEDEDNSGSSTSGEGEDEQEAKDEHDNSGPGGGSEDSDDEDD